MTTQLIGLNDIEARTRNYRAARDLLGERLRQLNDRIEAAKREAMPLIRSALATAKAAENELSGAIESAPQLFRRPRTVIFHGVKVGIEKGKGQIRIEDADRTLTLIKKHLPDQVELLIRTQEVPLKTPIAQLTAADLKRIGVEIVEAGDQVVIKAVDGELDKMLNTLLKAEEVEIGEPLQQAA